MLNWLKRLPGHLLRSLLWLLLVLLLALMAGGSWLLGSEPGGRWLLGQVPGLEVEQVRGRLGGEWHAERLDYRSGDTRVTVEGPHIAWRPGCLLRLDVCLDRLHSGDVTLQLPPGEAPEEAKSGDSPIELPNIELPVTIRVADLDIGAVRLNGDTLIAGANLSAAMEGDTLQLHYLQVQRDTLKAEVSGSLTLQGDWPLSLALNAQMALPDERPPLIADARLRGSMASLQTRVDLSSPWQAVLEGTVSPLQPPLPASLTLSAESIKADPSLPETLTLQDLELALTGNLNDGWDLRLDGNLATTPAMAMTLRGHAGLDSASVESLRVSASERQFVAVSDARVDWSGELEAKASLSWRDFPWNRLLPEVTVPPVAMEALDMDISLQGEAYQGHLDALVSTPQGPVLVDSPLAGNFRQLRLPRLSIAGTPGRVHGGATVDFADQLGWQLDLALAGINPGHFVRQLPGRIQGRLRSQGTLTESGPQLSADLGLKGRLRDQPLTLDLAAAMDGQAWTLKSLQGRMGDNRLEGQASQSGAGALDGRLSLAMERLDQLWPGLEGALNGSFQGRDLLRSPSGSTELALHDIGFEPQSLALETLTLKGDLDRRQTGSLALDWSGLAIGEQQVESGELRLDGSESDHKLSLAVEHAMASLNLSAQGGHTEGVWQGALEQGRVRALEQDWQLQEPAALTVNPAERIVLGGHCWGWEQARLCLEDEQRLFPRQRLRVALSDLPTRAFEDFLPPDMRWQETLDARVALDMDERGPRGDLWVDAGEGHFQLLQTLDPGDEEAMENASGEGHEQRLRLDYSQLRLEARLDPDEATLGFRLKGPDLGDVNLDAAMDTRDGNYPLTGRLSLENLNLALARAFVDLQQVQGRLQGEASLAGTLQKPEVSGQIRLEDGQLSDPSLPMAIDHLALQLDVSGSQAQLSGDLRSGEQGQGRIRGEMDWSEGVQATVNIDGDRLPVTLEPFARLTLVPDIEIRYDDQKGLFVGGRLGVPEGAIRIREIPPSAVQVSEDEEIAGQAPKGEPMKLRMDLRVVVGEEKVSFNGFGVTGNLKGQLRLGDNMQARGDLSLEDGRYEIYGQRLRIRRARVIFAGPLDQPFLDIEAVRETRDVVAGVRLTGRANDPQTEIFSEPSLSEQQALSYLLLGRPLQSEGDSNVVGEVALSMGLSQTAPITRDIGERVGIRDLQLETEGYGQDASVVASGYITEKLSLRYGVGLFQPVNRIAVRYDLTQRVFLEAASGLANSLDIFYQRDY